MSFLTAGRQYHGHESWPFGASGPVGDDPHAVAPTASSESVRTMRTQRRGIRVLLGTREHKRFTPLLAWAVCPGYLLSLRVTMV